MRWLLPFQIRSGVMSMCLDAAPKNLNSVILYPCHGQGGNQVGLHVQVKLQLEIPSFEVYALMT